MEHLVVTAPPGCIVLDPFAGSGTTAVACIKTGRKFIGVEIEETYCEIAAKRIEEAFESEALLAGVGTMETAPCES
jgi:DNA modification methylase